MKQLIVLISIVFFSISSFAQESKDIVTKKYKVEGNCNMCKKRIEDAAYTKGVKRAEWDKETQILTLTYRSSKTTDDAVLANVAKAGHSSEKTEATEADYKKLPDCCHYKTHTCND
jgi:hypothetical protein